MNKYLREVEIVASNSFGEEAVLAFTLETRKVISDVNEKLGKNVKSKYGKLAVMLMPASIIQSYELPDFEYDNISGVCVRNYSYELDIYSDTNDSEKKHQIVLGILHDVYSNLSGETGVDREALVEILQSL